MKKKKNFIISFLLLLSLVSVQKMFFAEDFYSEQRTVSVLCEYGAEPYGSPYEQEIES